MLGCVTQNWTTEVVAERSALELWHHSDTYGVTRGSPTTGSYWLLSLLWDCIRVLRPPRHSVANRRGTGWPSEGFNQVGSCDTLQFDTIHGRSNI